MSPGEFSLIGRMMESVCCHYNVNLESLHLPGRTARMSEARFMVMDFAASLGVPDEQIGALLSRCRSEIQHGRKAFQNRLDTEPKLKAKYDALRKEIVGV